ncbi:Gag-Pol polyprotein [Gossypium australe]|uniref:Gag-Pol polyprotein n=1 Tax=Gossypium australe TaxID=47621 RepID=A0A5B6WT68_9ROSI|nr:Gag-Pol polyprotein [Gossypium australe]
MACTQCGQHGHNKWSCTNSKQSSRTTRSMTTASCQDGSGQTSSTPKSRNNKRKAPLDHLRTQELVAGNMRPSRGSS